MFTSNFVSQLVWRGHQEIANLLFVLSLIADQGQDGEVLGQCIIF